MLQFEMQHQKLVQELLHTARKRYDRRVSPSNSYYIQPANVTTDGCLRARVTTYSPQTLRPTGVSEQELLHTARKRYDRRVSPSKSYYIQPANVTTEGCLRAIVTTYSPQTLRPTGVSEQELLHTARKRYDRRVSPSKSYYIQPANVTTDGCLRAIVTTYNPQTLRPTGVSEQ